MEHPRALVCLTLLFAALTIDAAAAGGVDHSIFSQFLAANVDDAGMVDYAAVRQKQFDLLTYLDVLVAADVNAMTHDEQLAYYINLYNASALAGIAERYHANYSPAENDYELFGAKLVRAGGGGGAGAVGGQTMTLRELEQKIRQTFKDPRVHASLVNGARSAPVLPRRAFAAADLDATLDACMRRFVNDGSRNRIDRAGRRLVLSKIFEWSADDFGGAGGLAAFISKFADGGNVQGFSVGFADYDWTLNAKR